MALVRNPDTGSQIGLALLRFDLTQTQAAAALNFAELRGRYHRLSGIRSYAEASPAYERGWGGFNPNGPHTTNEVERAARKAKRKYERSVAAIPTSGAEDLLVRLPLPNLGSGGYHAAFGPSAGLDPAPNRPGRCIAPFLVRSANCELRTPH